MFLSKFALAEISLIVLLYTQNLKAFLKNVSATGLLFIHDKFPASACTKNLKHTGKLYSKLRAQSRLRAMT